MFPCKWGVGCPCVLPHLLQELRHNLQASLPTHASQVLSIKKKLNEWAGLPLLWFHIQAGVVSPVDFCSTQGTGGIKVGLRL